MSVNEHSRIRLWLAAAVAVAECAHLAWEHFNGGIVSHHVLNRADLPSISNAWGVLLLPALAWFLGGQALEAVHVALTRQAAGAGVPANVIAGFTVALTLGVLLCASFTLGHEAATSFVFSGLFVLALFVRVYRAECVLGFVLGMTFTFGAVLPLAVALIIASVSAVAHRLVWPVLRRLLARSRTLVPRRR